MEQTELGSKAIQANAIQVGALAPLSLPGWVQAGQDLIAGLSLAVDDINESGGVLGSRLELIVRDTAANPDQAAAAVDELAHRGVVALVGEYHSVSAQAIAAMADSLKLPYLCSSAVIDALIDHPSDWIARLCPPQSLGWTTYASYLLESGHRVIATAAKSSAYWAAGVSILRDYVNAHGGSLVEIESSDLNHLCAELVTIKATVVLLLAGFPDPIIPTVKAIRRHALLGHILIGAPAGQPEFVEWRESLGETGRSVPFLRYMPEVLTPLGDLVDSALRARLGRAPSFVAYEGYDTILVLHSALKITRNRFNARVAWAELSVRGTRGTVTFSKSGEMNAWQWESPPIEVVHLHPADGELDVLHAI